MRRLRSCARLGCGPALLLAGLSACTDLAPPANLVAARPPTPGLSPPTAAGPRGVAVLLPLSGPNAALGHAMLNAVQLAFAAGTTPSAIPLDIQDTAGNPEQAAAAAAKVVADNDTLMIGPLTAQETAAVAGTARAANLPVLAFTSDASAAQPGIWPLGVTVTEQIRRLVSALHNDGRQKLAALVPDTAFGHAFADALPEPATAAGLELAASQTYPEGFAPLNDALKQISDYQVRRGDRDARIKAARESPDPAMRAQIVDLQAAPVPPPPFDSVLVADAGPALGQLGELLPFYDMGLPGVRVVGPAVWGPQAGRLGKLAGAWYAAPDPAARREYAQAYAAKYGGSPPPLADLAFDAAAIARALTTQGQLSSDGLTRDEGFVGVDGAIAFRPNGTVLRGLAIFEIDEGGGAHIVSPAPQDLSSPNA